MISIISPAGGGFAVSAMAIRCVEMAVANVEKKANKKKCRATLG
jgi:hypothetical protein